LLADALRSDDAIAYVIIDAAGPKAFWAGRRVLRRIYATVSAGDFGPGASVLARMNYR